MMRSSHRVPTVAPAHRLPFDSLRSLRDRNPGPGTGTPRSLSEAEGRVEACRTSATTAAIVPGKSRSVESIVATPGAAVMKSTTFESLASRRAIAEVIADGNAGVAAIPGKHGRSERFARLTVLIDDRPGQLAQHGGDGGGVGAEDLHPQRGVARGDARRVAQALPGQAHRLGCGAGQARREQARDDLRLEHSPGAQVGLAEIAVVPEAVDRLTDALVERGWRIAGGGE